MLHAENTSQAISFQVIAPGARTIGSMELRASGMKSHLEDGATAGDEMTSKRRVTRVPPDVAAAGTENSDCVNAK